MSSPGPRDSALGLVVDAYSVAVTHWRRLFVATVPVLAAAQLLSFVIPAVVSGADGVIVNGRLEASETAQRWTTASLRIEAFDGDLYVAIPVVLLLGWAIALTACLSVVAGMYTGEPLGPGSARQVLRRAPAWTALAITVGMVVVPALALMAASAVEDGLANAWATRSTSGAVAVGVGTLLSDLALFAIVPAQATVLMKAFLWARDTEVPPALAATAPSAPRRLSVAALVLVALSPSVLGTGYVLVNPHGVAVVSIGEPQGWSVDNPLTTGILASGEIVIVNPGDIIVCPDPRCDQGASVGLPCIDGGPMRPMAQDAMGCSIEAPIAAAALRPDGTVVALRRGKHNDLRLYWCLITSAQQCEWGGATTIHQLQTIDDVSSIALASTPGGGVVASFVTRGNDQRNGQVMLITCRDLPCAEPRLSRVGEVPVPEWFGDGPLALAVNQVNGGLAIGYHDRNTGELWLGGCPSVGCADLSLKPAGRWKTADDGNPSVGRLTLAAGRTGPVAVPPDGGAGTATVVVCKDATCDSHHELTVDTPPGGASLVTDQNGTAYVVSAAAVASAVGSRPALTLISVADQGRGGSTPLLIPSQDAQRVVAVIFDSDDRPRVLLSTLAGLVVITCAN